MTEEKVRRMHGEERRQLILQSAAELFSSKGYFGATLQDLADTVGIKKGSIYHFYQSKDDLLYDILRMSLTAPQEAFDRVIMSDRTYEDKLVELIAALVRSYDEMLPWMVVFASEDIDSVAQPERRAELVTLRRRFESTWESVLRDGVESGEFRNDLDYRVVTYGILGMMNWMFKWYDPSGRVSSGEIAHVFSSLVLGGLLADRTPTVSS